MSYLIAVPQKHLKTVSCDVLPLAADIDIFLGALLIWTELEPKGALGCCTFGGVVVQRPLRTRFTRSSEQFINATTGTKGQHQDTETKVVKAIELVFSVTMQR